MAFLRNIISSITNTFLKASEVPFASISPIVIPNRTKWVDARMARDAKRRKVVKEYAKLRCQINCVKSNTILPKEIREIAAKELHAFPRSSCLTHTHPRCVITSRARGRLRLYRMSRIVWRHLADYNKLSGVERAMWNWS